MKKDIREVVCFNCNGSGEIIKKNNVVNYSIKECKICNGEGIVQTYRGMRIITVDKSFNLKPHN